jgi:hypothetical protein
MLSVAASLISSNTRRSLLLALGHAPAAALSAQSEARAAEVHDLEPAGLAAVLA